MNATQPDPEAIAAGFAKARERLRFEHANQSGKLHALFSAATLSRLMKSEADYPSESFSPAVRERLVWAYNADTPSGVYGGIESMIGQSEIGRRIIQDNFVGEYSLFRFDKGQFQYSPPPLNSDKADHLSPMLEYIEERISISIDKDGEPEFKYWMSGNNTDDHDLYGAVFYSIGKLFLTGTAQDTICLAILQVSRMNEPLHGFWTTTLSRGSGLPFSARVLMVNHKSETMLANLRGSESSSNFLQLTGGSYAYYMTVT